VPDLIFSTVQDLKRQKEKCHFKGKENECVLGGYCVRVALAM
jgi:hypothetical protein